METIDLFFKILCIESSNENQLFEMETFCDINVFTVIFDHLYIEFSPTVKKKYHF